MTSPVDRAQRASSTNRRVEQRGAGPRTAAPAHRLLPGVLVALAIGVATASVVGPLVLDLMRYRTSPTTLNQLLGSDAAALFLVSPLTLVAAALALRGHRSAPVLASGIGLYCLYTYAQVVVGQEYLRLPGNVERFFPLLLAVFVLAEATVVVSWRATPRHLPAPSRRLERTAGWTLVLLAAFLVLGQHLRPMVTAWTAPASLTEYASSPTPFWLVKLTDLGMIAPAAVVTGVGLLRRAPWARRVMYPLLTGYTCLACSVCAMAVVMLLNRDPDASPAVAAGFGAFGLMVVCLTGSLYRTLFRPE